MTTNNSSNKRSANSNDDDRRYERKMRVIAERRLFTEEMEQRKAQCSEWLREMGFDELRGLLNDACRAQNPFSIIAQLHSAVFGGERNGEPYDGLESITFDELAEALQCAKEGHSTIRESIKADRFMARQDAPNASGFVSGFERSKWDF